MCQFVFIQAISQVLQKVSEGTGKIGITIKSEGHKTSKNVNAKLFCRTLQRTSMKNFLFILFIWTRAKRRHV